MSGTDAAGCSWRIWRSRSRARRRTRVRRRDRRIERREERAQRGEAGRQRHGDVDGVEAAGKGRGTPGGDGDPLAMQETAHETEIAGAGAHESLTHGEGRPRFSAPRCPAMRRAKRPEPVGLGQGPRIAAIGLHAVGAGSLHRGVVRIGDDDLVAEHHQRRGRPRGLRAPRQGAKDPGADYTTHIARVSSLRAPAL